MSDIQEQVQQALDELVGSGVERGIQVAAYQDGSIVVDAVAGVADPAAGRPVDSSTPFYNFSIGKGATSTIAHVLAERGLLELDGVDAPGLADVQGKSDRAVPNRRVRHPDRRPRCRHSRRWEDVGPGHRPACTPRCWATSMAFASFTRTAT